MKSALVSALLLGTILSFPAHGQLNISTINYLKEAWEKPSFFNPKVIYSLSNTSSPAPIEIEEGRSINDTNTIYSAVNYNNLTILSRNKNSSLGASGMSHSVPISLANLSDNKMPAHYPLAPMPSNMIHSIAFVDSPEMVQNNHKKNNFSLPTIHENGLLGSGKKLNANTSFHTPPVEELTPEAVPQSATGHNLTAHNIFEDTPSLLEDQILSMVELDPPTPVEVVISDETKKPADQAVVEIVSSKGLPVVSFDETKKPADQEIVQDENALSNIEFSAPPPAPPPPPPGVIKGKQLILKNHDLNKLRLTKKASSGNRDVAEDIKNGNFSLKKRQPVAEERETHELSAELLRNAFKNLKKVNRNSEGAEGSSDREQSVLTGLQKQNNFYQSRLLPADRLDKRGVTDNLLQDHIRNLKKVSVAEKQVKVDDTAGARIMGRSLDANALSEFEKRRDKSAQLRQGFQAIKLKKTPGSEMLYQPAPESEESLARKSQLKKFIEKRELEARLELEKKKEEARLSAGRILTANKAMEKEAAERIEAAKKNIGKKSVDSGELTLLEQIRAGKKLKPVVMVDKKVLGEKLNTLIGGEDTTSPNKNVKKADKIEAHQPPIIKVNHPPKDDVPIKIPEVLLKKINETVPGNEESVKPEKLLKSLKKHQDFFNHTQTELEELNLLLSKASQSVLDWLSGEISKAKDFDPEWGDDVEAYKAGDFFILAKEKLQEKPVIVVQEEKKAPSRLNFGKVNGQVDLLSQIRAMKKDDAEILPIVAPLKSNKVKDFILNANKAGGDLFGSIRAGKNEEAEEVFAVHAKIIKPTESVIEPEVIFLIPPPPPPPFVAGLGKGKLPLSEGVVELAPKVNKLPEVANNPIIADDFIDSKNDIRAALAKRRVVIVEDEDEDDSDSDFDF